MPGYSFHHHWSSLLAYLTDLYEYQLEFTQRFKFDSMSIIITNINRVIGKSLTNSQDFITIIISINFCFMTFTKNCVLPFTVNYPSWLRTIPCIVILIIIILLSVEIEKSTSDTFLSLLVRNYRKTITVAENSLILIKMYSITIIIMLGKQIDNSSILLCVINYILYLLIPISIMFVSCW